MTTNCKPKLFYALADPAAYQRDIALALGFFDGLHLGHQTLLHRIKEIGEQSGCMTLAYTFRNHPLTVLAPEFAPKLLTTPYEKTRLFSKVDVDQAWILPFDRSLADLSYQSFMLALLDKLHIKHVVVGFNYVFGSERKGTPALLAQLGKRHGFEVHVMPSLEMDGQPISSTRIRQAVRAGEMETARRMLGRPYTLSGYVKHGQGLGHTRGVATANFTPPPSKALPPNGVYASKVVMDDGASFDAITNVGTRPSVNDDGRVNAETHILDFHGMIYEQHIDVQLYAMMRPERKFDSLNELYDQISRDVQQRKTLFAKDYLLK